MGMVSPSLHVTSPDERLELSASTWYCKRWLGTLDVEVVSDSSGQRGHFGMWFVRPADLEALAAAAHALAEELRQKISATITQEPTVPLEAPCSSSSSE